MTNLVANTNEYTQLSHIIHSSAHTSTTNVMMFTVFKD